MDFAFHNLLARTDHMPPADPWMSGATIIDTARDADVKVIDYDRLTAAGSGADAYVSFDNVKVGQTMADTVGPVIDELPGTPNVVMMNGGPTDNNSKLFKQGYNETGDFAVSKKADAGDWKVVADQDVPDWDNQTGGQIFEQMLATAGGSVDGVLAANDGLAGAVIAVLKKNNLVDAYMRPVAWRGSEELSVPGRNNKVHVAIAAWVWPSYFSTEEKLKGIRLEWSKWKRPSPETIPSAAKAAGLYMICTLSKDAAMANGYADALMLDYRGLVAEATGANVFFVKGDEIVTPAPDCFLNGITRQTLIQLARENLRATQILQERMETIWLYNWDQLNTPGFVPTSFEAPFYPVGGQAGQGLTYKGAVAIEPSGVTESYANDLRKVTVRVNWVSGSATRAREMSTMVSRYGMHNYIYYSN